MTRRRPGEPASEADAIALCRASSAAGRYAIAAAAHERLKARGLGASDVRLALDTARTCVRARAAPATATNVAAWTLTGLSVDGGELTVTVAFDEGVILVL